MIDLVMSYVVPMGYAVLPTAMNSPRATAFLVTVGLQESGFLERRQIGGPALGFFQFERAGVKGILTHPRSRPLLLEALRLLRYGWLAEQPLDAAQDLYRILEHHDPLAFVCARLLLWTLSDPLPRRNQVDIAWRQYVMAWGPGKPRRDSWNEYYAEAWRLVTKAGANGPVLDEDTQT